MGPFFFFPNHWIRLHLASIFSFFRNASAFEGRRHKSGILPAPKSLHLRPAGQTQGFSFGPWRGCYGFKNNGMIFPSKRLCNFPAASGSSSSPLIWVRCEIEIGDVALLLALVTFCARIIFTLTIKLRRRQKCLGILLIIFHNSLWYCGVICGELMS